MAGRHGVQGRKIGIGHVGDVHVLADHRAVPVDAEDIGRARRHRQRRWDDPAPVIVRVPARGARDVEGAQHHRADPAGRGLVGDDLLGGNFGGAVCVRRCRRLGLGDGLGLGCAVDRAA